MVQTQIQLTEEQLATLEELAKQRNVSLSSLIREGIDHLLRSAASPWNGKAERKQRALAVAGRFRSGRGDLSRGHDDYAVEAFDT